MRNCAVLKVTWWQEVPAPYVTKSEMFRCAAAVSPRSHTKKGCVPGVLGKDEPTAAGKPQDGPSLRHRSVREQREADEQFPL